MKKGICDMAEMWQTRGIDVPKPLVKPVSIMRQCDPNSLEFRIESWKSTNYQQIIMLDLRISP